MTTGSSGRLGAATRPPESFPTEVLSRRGSLSHAARAPTKPQSLRGAFPQPPGAQATVIPTHSALGPAHCRPAAPMAFQRSDRNRSQLTAARV